MLKRKESNKIQKIADDVETEINSVLIKKEELSFDNVISTGSTLLDLNISGKRRRDGGIPGGIIAEIFGPAGSGKTAVLAEIAASAQVKSGDALFLDPEARLDQEYARIYGMILEAKNYSRPDTVANVFDKIYEWEPEDKTKTNVILIDSLAALSTELELEKGDKMGMKRAKDFSQGLRKTARLISNNKWVVACTNQVRDGEYGETTPGGKAIPFYSSLRIRVSQSSVIEKKVKINDKEIKKIIGIESKCFIKKSTVDEPFRTCDIYIIFGYGIDDVRGNLQYIKDMTNSTVYLCPNDKTYQSIEKAIFYIEENNLQIELKNKTIELWNEIEDHFKVTRIPKVRK
jgi:recombination protein RecA